MAREWCVGEKGSVLDKGIRGHLLLTRWHVNRSPVQWSEPCSGWAKSVPESRGCKGPDGEHSWGLWRGERRPGQLGQNKEGGEGKGRTIVMVWAHSTREPCGLQNTPSLELGKPGATPSVWMSDSSHNDLGTINSSGLTVRPESTPNLCSLFLVFIISPLSKSLCTCPV